MNIKIRLGVLALTASILLILSMSPTYRAFGFTSNFPIKPTPIVLTDDQGKYPLGTHLEILEDTSGKLTIDEVSSPAFDARFTPSHSETPNYGFTNKVYWVRFTLDNKARRTVEWLLELDSANMHYVDLYTPLPGNEGFKVSQSGTMRPVSTRDVLYPKIVFNLPIPTSSQPTYYLRFQNGATMSLSLTLWAKDAFLNQPPLELIWHWLISGILMGLFVYNLFLFISLRETNYIHYVLVIAATFFFLLCFDGYLEAYFIPNLYYLIKYIFLLTFSLISFATVLFADSFLELKTRLPKLHTANITILGIWSVVMLLIFFTSYYLINSLILCWSLVSLMVVLASGIISLQRDFRPARFFLIAWSGLLVTLSMVILARIGRIQITNLTDNLFRLGLIWLCVGWSFALADRINLLKAETKSAYNDLTNSESQLSQILEGLPLGVVRFGVDMKTRYINKRAMDILSDPSRIFSSDPAFGLNLAQVIKLFSLKLPGSPEDYPIDKFPVFHALQGDQASADDIEIDLGDKRVPLESWASPIKDHAGSVASAVLVFQDITQRKQAEAVITEYKEQLETLVEKRTNEISAINIWLDTINAIHQTMSGTKDLPVAYKKLSTMILLLLDAKTVFILHWGSLCEQYELNCGSQPGNTSEDELIMRLQTAFQQDSPLRREVERGKTRSLQADQAGEFDFLLRECLHLGRFQSLVLAPMITHQKVDGVLGVVFSQPIQEISPQHISLMEKMAVDLANLTENSVLLDRALDLATTEERNHLARELHDSVTQTLFTASVLAESTPRIWDKDQRIGRQNMEKLSVLIRGALAEMRSMLIALRSGELYSQTLDQLLVTLVEAGRVRTNTVIDLAIMNIPELPKNVTYGLYRMAQEALNNAIIHADATRIDISLLDQNGQVVLLIQDDGRGFDQRAIPADHLGINIMAERAGQIGGEVRISSQPGNGTEIVIIWPKRGGGLGNDDRLSAN